MTMPTRSKVAAVLALLRRAVPDLLAGTGCLTVLYGLYRIYVPLALISGGIALVGLGVVATRETST